jgi:hypothetical protein
LLFLLQFSSDSLQVFSYFTQDIGKDTRNAIKPLLDSNSKEIAERFDHITNGPTGGDSYAYFIPKTHMYTSTSEPPSYNDVVLWLEHKGKYPLYDIQIRLVDIQVSNQIRHKHLKSPMTLEEITAATETTYLVPRLDPSRSTPVIKLDLPANVDRWDFSVFFLARNGGWAQELRFLRNKDRHWGLASRTIRNGEVLQEDGSQGLPKDETGKPKWN